MGLIRDIWCETDIRWLFVKQCCPVFISTSGSSFAFSKHSRRITPFKKKSLSLSHTHRYCGHYISSHRAVANSQRGPALESHIYMQPSSPLALSLLRSLFHRSEVFHILWIHTFLSICCSRCFCMIEHPQCYTGQLGSLGYEIQKTHEKRQGLHKYKLLKRIPRPPHYCKQEII